MNRSRPSFASRVLSRLGSLATGASFSLPADMASSDAVEVLARRGSEALRGAIARRKFARANGPFFVGRRVTIRHGRHVVVGRACVLGDDVLLDAFGGAGIRLGDRVSIGRGSTLIVSGVVSRPGVGIRIGSRVGITEYCHIGGQGGVTIEDDVIIGPGARVFSEDHRFDDLHVPIRDQGEHRQSVLIGAGSWVGAGAIIVSGVTIGPGAVIAAGSVVTRDVEAGHVVAGVPARSLRVRPDFQVNEPPRP